MCLLCLFFYLDFEGLNFYLSSYFTRGRSPRVKVSSDSPSKNFSCESVCLSVCESVCLLRFQSRPSAWRWTPQYMVYHRITNYIFSKFRPAQLRIQIWIHWICSCFPVWINREAFRDEAAFVFSFLRLSPLIQMRLARFFAQKMTKERKIPDLMQISQMEL